jgi:hypothetical protein
LYRTHQNRTRKTENPYCPATPTCSIVPYPPKQSQRNKKKTRTVPPTTPAKCPKYTRTGPALYTAETPTQANMYVTRLARKFPRAQHTQLKKTEHETISIHTQITEITVKTRKRKFSPIKCSIQHMILGNKKVDNFMSKNKKVQTLAN